MKSWATKNKSILVLVAGLLCLVAAHAFSRLGGRVSGSVDMMPGESVEVSPGVSLELKSFAIPRYESGKPRQFESEIALHGQKEVCNKKVTINHPLVDGLTWIYQTEDYDKVTERETTLTVVRDRSLPVAAIGALLLLIGAFSVLRVTHAQASAGSLDGRAREVTSTTGKTGRVLPAVAVTVIPLFVVSRIVFRADPPPSLQSWLMAPHVGAYVASYIILLFAAFGVGRRFMALGFFLMTLGLVLGATWGQFCWMNYWQNDPKELASLATWLVYLAYFILNSKPRAERIFRWAGAGMIIFTSTVVNFAKIFAGLHSY